MLEIKINLGPGAHGREVWGIKLQGLNTDIRGETALKRMCDARRVPPSGRLYRGGF